MCMEEIKIGRNAATNIATFANPTSQVVAGQSRNRVRLIFTMVLPGGVSNIRLWPRRAGQFAATMPGGINLSPESPNFILRIEEFGTAIFDEWIANGNAAGEVLTVFDVTLEAHSADGLTLK